MIDLEKSYKTTEFQGSEVSYFDFECESCGHRYYNYKLNLSVFLYGVAFLTGPKCSFVCFTCLSCLKTNLLKSNDLQGLKQDLEFFLGPNGSEAFPDLRYHSPVLFPPEQIPELKDFNIITWEYFLSDSGHKHFHDHLNSHLTENPWLEEGYLCSYINDGELPIGTMATILWVNPRQIEALVEIENEHHIHVFPRYIHKVSWYERYDSFCWRYKLYQDYLAGMKMFASENFNQLSEIARQNNVNLDNLIDANPDNLIDDNTDSLQAWSIENCINQAQQNAANDVTAAAEFLDLLINYDPDPWDVPGDLSDLYKKMWKSVKPFKGSLDKATSEDSDPGKFELKITDTKVNEMVDDIRPHIAKSHVQQWANENHLNFIKDYTSLGHGLDFSYGYVWELKCQYLQRLHKTLDKVSIRDAQYALYQTGPTWSLIFDGNEIVGLERYGFKYVNFLIQHPGEPYKTYKLDSLLDSPASEEEKDDYDGLPKEDRHELIGSTTSKKFDSKLSKEEIVRYIKEKEELSEYLDTVIQNEKMEKEKPGSSKIDLISLKEFKTEAKSKIKNIDTTLKNGGFEYIQKEMIKKQQQRISKSIERAVKELETFDKTAFTHLMDALSPINSMNIMYKTSKNIKWETK